MAGSGSYRKINYRLRPAKTVERKMVVEALRRLILLGTIEEYQYVGLGSIYFSDFLLFHKSLGVGTANRPMQSIQEDGDDKERFEMNRPFNCVEILFGDVGDKLPEIDFSIKTIFWLDYDGVLSNTTLEDVSYVCSRAIPGTVFLTTVNAEKLATATDLRNREEKGEPGTYTSILEEKLGKGRVPLGLKNSDFHGAGTAKVYREILNNEIQYALLERNRGVNEQERILYKQLFNIRHKDDANMLTVGGILYLQKQEQLLRDCHFEHLPQCSSGESQYEIIVPKLTLREIAFLNSQLPKTPGTSIVRKGIPKEDVERYEKIYRYFPSFAEADF